MSNLYSRRGVSSEKEEVHAAIKNLDKGLYAHSFCKILPDLLSHDERYCTVMHADGAGTKSSLAYAYWRETGDLSVWEGIAQDAIVMNTDDLLCVGVCEDMVLSSTIGRNKRFIPGEVVAALINGTEKFLQTLRDQGIGIFSAGGETADLGDLVRTVVVDSTLTARPLRSKIIDNANLCPELAIVGLSSSGQASYESAYNSGIGSNGLTSARHDIFSKELAQKYPETFDNGLDESVVYCGQHGLNDIEAETGISFGKLVLSPTRTYAPIVKQILEECRSAIRGMVHCSGGGQTKILHFINELHVVKDNFLPIPPLFHYIQKAAKTDWKEMYKTFNMGHRFELYVEPWAAESIIQISKSYHIEAQIIGRTESATQSKLTLKTPNGEFVYHSKS
jgi:phosphoribosylformylglycinamidine cyclo-ligase